MSRGIGTNVVNESIAHEIDITKFSNATNILDRLNGSYWVSSTLTDGSNEFDESPWEIKLRNWQLTSITDKPYYW